MRQTPDNRPPIRFSDLLKSMGIGTAGGTALGILATLKDSTMYPFPDTVLALGSGGFIVGTIVSYVGPSVRKYFQDKDINRLLPPRE